jgi:hypothetical protein
MYAEHNPIIADAMRADVEIFKRGCLFALLSIRQPIRNVPAQMEDVERAGMTAHEVSALHLAIVPDDYVPF